MANYTTNNLGTMCSLLEEFYGKSEDTHFDWVIKGLIGYILTYVNGKKKIIATVDFTD